MHFATRFKNAACAALFASASTRLCAQATPDRQPTGVTLADAVAAALRQNPDALLAQVAADSARAERRIATSLPNPTLATIPNSPFQYAASIAIDATPARFYRTRAATLGIGAADADRSDAIRQIKFAVTKAFFDLLLSERKRDLTAARRDAMRQLLAADSIRYRSGEIPFHNLARSEVEMARADADLARADVDVQSGRITLQSLMGRTHSDSTFAVRGSLDYRRLETSTDSLVAAAMARRPDLDAASQRLGQSRAARQTTTAMFIPTPVISYVRQYAAPFDNGRHAAIGLSFELPSLDLFSGERARAASSIEAARLSRRRLELSVERDVTSATAEFKIQRALVERYQSGLLARVDDSVEGAKYAYASGATSLLDVLDAVRSQQDVRIDYYTALHDYWLSVYAVNAAVGTDVFGIER